MSRCHWPKCRREAEITYSAVCSWSVELCDKHFAKVHEMSQEQKIFALRAAAKRVRAPRDQ